MDFAKKNEKKHINVSVDNKQLIYKELRIILFKHYWQLVMKTGLSILCLKGIMIGDANFKSNQI